MTTSGPIEHKHVIELQTIRGVAALVVLLQHCGFYFIDIGLARQVIELLFNAHAAVIIFFVLSGYVLTLSLKSKDLTVGTVGAFYVRRAFRIFPALWAASLFALGVVLLLLNRDDAPLSNAFARAAYSLDQLSVGSIAFSFAGIGLFLVPQIWTIRVELLGSAIIPLPVFGRFGRLANYALLIVVLTVLSFVVRSEKTVYLVEFAIGGSLAFFPLGRMRLRPNIARLLAAAVLVVLLFSRQLGPWPFQQDYHAPTPAMIEALAAAVLILIITENPSSFALLRSRIGLFIGDVSYSLYLLHFPIMVAVARIGGYYLGLSLFTENQIVAAATLAIVTTVISLALAWASYRYIELPGISLGRALIRRLGLGRPKTKGVAFGRVGFSEP
ncbi:acyltransferase [Bradyrhizobium manausense]|uniref:acyltransferase family protein n=1 Tax=Bradyrhizobium manausense TaxID=989370 RepID=UPI001BA9F20D|nr:acyltransferase [Bradyrhizobium manausense]MBR0829864.1 acyltransferase [Bradyrhizobium manausense]